MQFMNDLKNLFSTYQPFLVYFYPFVAFSVFFVPVKMIKMFTGGRNYG